MKGCKGLHTLALFVVAAVVSSTACGRSAAGSSPTSSTQPSASPAVAASTSSATIAPFTTNPTATASVPSTSIPERATATPAPVLTATSGAALVVSGTGKSGLKLRETPNGKVVVILPEGAGLEAQGDQQQAAGLTWVHVHTADGKDGWVAASFVTKGTSTTGTSRAAGSVTPTPASQ